MSITGNEKSTTSILFEVIEKGAFDTSISFLWNIPKTPVQVPFPVLSPPVSSSPGRRYFDLQIRLSLLNI